MINSHEWPYNGYGSTLGEWVSMIISQLGMALAGLSCILGDCKYWNILIVVWSSIPLSRKRPATKSDDSLEKFQKGGGLFSIQKFMLQILGTLNRAF